jgi:hypothetical protein
MTVIENNKTELIPQQTITGLRMRIDYRKLNTATKKDHFPLSFIDEILEQLAKHSFFYFLDRYSGYHQIPIHPDDQSKTTFTCLMERMPIVECRSGFAMHPLRSKGA